MTGRRRNGGGRWRPRWWVALTTVTSYAMGGGILIHEVLARGERPYILMVGVFLLSGASVTLLLERWRP